jgi:hypothetical protein
MHDTGCYPTSVRVIVWLLLVLLVLPAPLRSHAEDDGDDASGMARRLRAIDEQAEYEADHPDAADEEPAEDEEQDPTLTEHDDEPAAPAAPAARVRRDRPSARPTAKAPGGQDAAQPTLKSPLERAPEVDDDH